ncbi:heparinase II/III family protein [Paenibacillus sp. KQZ6P-2]|uniref:Heparinase II/III family protein n=1 Tax=Paenibacillus mangrovi TaxID=2931978 RepID=A0A9X2B3X3_9BACL|nr:alginate lyase family protein [Paenibacillus mangrovi]MCJ8010473.1 heparinase II/III family protein [Paenibacillus mangrovi]
MSTVQTKIRRLMEMPLRAAMKKIADKAIQEARFAYRQYRISRSPITLRPELFRSFESSSHFLVDPAKRQQYKEVLIAEGLNQEIIRDADQICEHVFNLLGSGDVHLGSSLPWHEDFKTGFRWENKFYKWIKIVDLDNVADVKVPWELSRFQHLFTFGKAYWLTDDEKYACEFKAQIDDWILRNPVEMSVNWSCAMDVAIRAANWIAAVPFFRKSPSIPDSFWESLHATLYLHGVFIRGNLENTGEHTGNHYTANLAGLVALGLYFGSFTLQSNQPHGGSPEEWLSFGMTEMEKEMFVQVNGDGTNYEASTSYHRLVAEMFLVTTIWCSQNGLYFSDRYLKRLEKMHEFMLSIMKPNGLTPLVGDADDGRYLIVSRYGSWVRSDFRHLMAVAGEFFDRDDFRAAGLGSAEDALWIAGRIKPVLEQGDTLMKSSAFSDGGYYVLRSREAYCLIRCGELSFHGHGAHSHNDQLSFELNVKGQDIIVDPGSYVYSADFRARNLFRSTAVHSTLQIDELEQNDIEERNLFLLREQTFALCDSFTDHHFSGSHQGYLTKAGFIHRREMKLEEAGLVIVDTMEKVGVSSDPAPSVSISLMLAPGVKVTGHQMNWVLETSGCRVAIAFEGAAEVMLHDAWVSASYGTRIRSQLLRVHTRNLSLKMNIRWE